VDASSVVIIGAGHAGVHAAASLRSLGHRGRLILLDQQPEIPYERPPLSKGVLVGSTNPQRTVLRKPDFYQEKGIDLRTDVRVAAIEPSEGRVNLAQGGSIPYDALLLATGAIGRPVDVPGAHLAGIFQLRSLADSLAIKAQLVAGVRIVIVGAGYIGLEVAAAAAKAGARVTILEREDRVMSRVTSAPVSRHFEELHRGHGVNIHLARQVAAFEGSHRVARVITAGGERFDADIVIVGIGILPAQELAVAAGLTCQDGVVVNSFCETSADGIYAAGDVTRHDSVFSDRSLRLECVQNAMSQAEVAARRMRGSAEPCIDVPWFWTDQYGCRLQSVGIRQEGDEVVLRGTPSSCRFSVLYLREGRLAAVDTVNMLKDFAPAMKLISARKCIDVSVAAHPELSLASML
jgi:3-phenylpropionate/trans-cinnamate dioxygenase ferredoxin reductase subunit